MACFQLHLQCLFIVLNLVRAQGKPSLHFSYMTARTGRFVAEGAIPVVDLALELINNRTDILPNYELTYGETVLDSKCDRTTSLDAYHKYFRDDSNVTYVSLFCCGCSTADIAVAEISHYWNVPQMAGIAATNELNDRLRFRKFFRTDPSTEFVGPALAVMAREFNWTQMAIISQRESLFLTIANSLGSALETEGRVLDKSIILDSTPEVFPYHLLHNLINEDNHRILVLNVHEPNVYAIVCEAAHLGWYPPKYAWITHSWLSKGWWNQDNGNNSCTPDIMSRMVDRSLSLNPRSSFVSDEKDMVTISGLTPETYRQEYIRRLQQERYEALNLTEFLIAGTEFDGIWAMALGLHEAAERVRLNSSDGCEHLSGSLVPLEDFTYLNDRMGCVLRESFQQVNFTGITGQVMFNSNGSRDPRAIRVQQYRIGENDGTDRLTVFDVTINENSSNLDFKQDSGVYFLWPDGAPYDGKARNQTESDHLALVSVYSIAAITGIAFAVVCIVFNAVFRNKRVVKLSSCNLNYIIIAGAILLYASVFLYVFYRPYNGLCNCRQVTVSLGYTLCFAVILAKTWRVYFIFSNPVPNKKVPKDWFLLVIILVVVAGDLIILLLGIIVPSSRLYAAYIRDDEHPESIDDEGIIYNNHVYVCSNTRAIVWLAISYAYKGLLQLVAMFMAFHTRRVKIKALNDSKTIAVVVYINSIILAMLAVVEFALVKYHQVFTVLFGLALLVQPTVFLALTFIPLMLQLRQDPDGEAAMKSSVNTTITGTTEGRDQSDEVANLKLQISRLEKRLAEVGQLNTSGATAVDHKADEMK